MKVFFKATALLIFQATTTTSFTSTSKSVWIRLPTSRPLASTASAESEAERLLRKARELREMAAQAEHQIHVDLAEKKAKKDAKTDAIIEHLFFQEDKNLVAYLHEKQLSIDTLEHIIDRLDEREVIAEGNEHVELVQGNDGNIEFHRVQKKDEQELQRLEGAIEALIEAVATLDEEFRNEKDKKGELYVSHTEDQHWGAGKRAERLKNRAHEIRREREEQFQKRLEEFYEAQRIKDSSSTPPKEKDEHGLIP